MLVAVIAEPTLERVLAEIERAKPYADLFEIRLDALEQLQLKRFSVPVLFTFRRGKIAEEERLQWIDRLLALEPEYCDLETDTDPLWIEKLVQKYPRTRFIGSYHDFEKTPADLDVLFASMRSPYFSFYKIATAAQSSLDLLRLMLFARHASLPVSCIAMGPFGLPSRVLGPVMGNPFDYAAVADEPFRYGLKTLCETYRYRVLDRNTAIYALLGDPVEQSYGSIFHNRVFEQENRKAVYVKMRLTQAELAAALSIMRQLPFRGFSITMPLKEAIVSLLDRLDPMAVSIGAVNTVAVREGLFWGSNTDGLGALNALARHIDVRGKKIALLGAGGSAKAIAFEAERRGAKVAVFNRTLSRAQSFGCQAFLLEQLPSYPCDILINTLPPTVQEIPCSLAKFSMDILYPPHRNSHLDGEAMWREQAQLQQNIWFPN